jgi:predicted ATPase
LITEFHAKDYGPLKDVSCALTPLHAFIGPNDSGKSSLLRGIVTAVNFAVARAPVFSIAPTGNVGVQVNEKWSFDCPFPITAPASYRGDSDARTWLLGGARLCRFDADALRRPSSLLPEDQALNFIDNRGFGVPAVLDILNNRNDGEFQAISRKLVELFPTTTRLQLINVSNSEKQISIILKDGTQVFAHAMSEGMLYYLAYAAIQRLGGAAAIGVEEPETGLHPSGISEIVRILRKLSESGTQVIIATHNPLIINELQPSEVSVVTRTEAGTQVTPMAETADFARRSKVYALGELWLSYANGKDEAPLLKGGPREILRDEDIPDETPTR